MASIPEDTTVVEWDDTPAPAAAKGETVKEGWLQKRGEYIGSWRLRYFVLKDSGSFQGFKAIPTDGDVPGNHFDVTNSTIVKDDSQAKKGKFGFTIRIMQISRIIERTFHTESAEERDEWIKAYESVKNARYRSASKVSLEARMRACSFANGKVQRIKQMSIDDFTMLKVLGKGAFGKVMLAKRKKTGEVFAIKILKKSMVLEKNELAHTLTESNILAKCQHPFLTELKFSFQTTDLLLFVMEYVNGGEIFFHLYHDKRFSEDRTRFYVGEIALALRYLHKQGIIYRDLKLENLMLDKEGHVKITDFGLCKENIRFGADTTSTFCGTPEYLAPEVVEDREYDQAVDWWGLGCVMYEMITGMLPFDAQDHEDLFDKILNDAVKVPPFLTAEAKDLIQNLLEKNPGFRLGGGSGGAEEVLGHAFFKPIDLAKLENKDIAPPFVPTIASDTDTANFDSTFTSEVPVITPPDAADMAVPADQKKELFKDFKTVS